MRTAVIAPFFIPHPPPTWFSGLKRVRCVPWTYPGGIKAGGTNYLHGGLLDKGGQVVGATSASPTPGPTRHNSASLGTLCKGINAFDKTKCACKS